MLRRSLDAYWRAQAILGRTFVALTAFALASPALAAPSSSDALIQSCQGLRRQSDRNKCLEEAVKSVAAQSATSQPAAQSTSPLEAARGRIAKVLDASRAIQSVTSSGVSLLQYEPYVQQFSIALDQFRTSAQTQEERDAAALLTEALQAYADAATYWQADIEFYSHNGNREAYRGAQPVGLTGTAYILERYDIPLRKSDVWGLEKGAALGEALRDIWAYAEEKTDAAQEAISNVGIPAQAHQKPGGSQPGAPGMASNIVAPKPKASAPPPAVVELMGKPATWRVSDAFIGGAYSDHDASSTQDAEPVAGKSVAVFASYGRWMRLTPPNEKAKWMLDSDLHDPQP